MYWETLFICRFVKVNASDLFYVRDSDRVTHCGSRSSDPLGQVGMQLTPPVATARTIFGCKIANRFVNVSEAENPFMKTCSFTLTLLCCRSCWVCVIILMSCSSILLRSPSLIKKGVSIQGVRIDSPLLSTWSRENRYQ